MLRAAATSEEERKMRNYFAFVRDRLPGVAKVFLHYFIDRRTKIKSKSASRALCISNNNKLRYQRHLYDEMRHRLTKTARTNTTFDRKSRCYDYCVILAHTQSHRMAVNYLKYFFMASDEASWKRRLHAQNCTLRFIHIE